MLMERMALTPLGSVILMSGNVFVFGFFVVSMMNVFGVRYEE